nr:hypothetical protein [Tanacetum cinerariifolium]
MVPDVSKKDSSNSDDNSWDDSEDESDDVNDEDDNDDDDGNDDDGGNDDDSGNDDDGDYEEEQQDEEYVLTPEKDKSDDEDKMYKEEDDDVAKEFNLLNLDSTGPDVNEIASLMNTSNAPPSPPPIKEEVNVAVRLQSNKIREEAQAENQEFLNQVDSTMKEIIKEQVLIHKKETNESINRSNIQRNLYNALVIAYNTDKDILSTYGDVVTLKRGRDDQDKHEDPSAGSNRGMKRRNKPLPLIEDRGRQVVPADYFINNDLEYLKGRSSSSKYATSTTRTKDAKYDNIKGIEDMVPTL